MKKHTIIFALLFFVLMNGFLQESQIESLHPCDVETTFLGKNWAARIFGPQKGATPEMIQLLETGLAN